MQPVQLLVDVLLWEYKDLEFLAFNQVGALGYLFYEHAQQVTSFLQELFAVTTKALLLGQGRNVQAGQTLNEAVSEGQKVLVPPLNLVILHSCWVDTVNDEDEMVPILLIAYDTKVSCELIAMQVASNSHELPLSLVISVF